MPIAVATCSVIVTNLKGEKFMTKFYVSFELDQRGDSVAWIHDLLLQGIRGGESLSNLRIIDGEKFNRDLCMLKEVKDNFVDFIDLFNYNNDKELCSSDKKLLNDFTHYINELRGVK